MNGSAKRAKLVSIKPTPVREFSEYESPSKSIIRKRNISHDACKKLNQNDLVLSTNKDVNKVKTKSLTLKKEEIGIFATNNIIKIRTILSFFRAIQCHALSKQCAN